MNLPDQQFIVTFFKSRTGAQCLISKWLPYTINGRKKKIMVYMAGTAMEITNAAARKNIAMRLLKCIMFTPFYRICGKRIFFVYGCR